MLSIFKSIKLQSKLWFFLSLNLESNEIGSDGAKCLASSFAFLSKNLF